MLDANISDFRNQQWTYYIKSYSPPWSFSVFFSFAVSRSSTFDFPEPIVVQTLHIHHRFERTVWQKRRAKQFNSLLNIN